MYIDSESFANTLISENKSIGDLTTVYIKEEYATANRFGNYWYTANLESISNGYAKYVITRTSN